MATQTTAVSESVIRRLPRTSTAWACTEQIPFFYFPFWASPPYEKFEPDTPQIWQWERHIEL